MTGESRETRKPLVAGQFYSDFDVELEEQIKGSFISIHGPGKLPGKRERKAIKGAIVPHAGYMFSGPAAAFSFKEIAESDFPELYILLGNSHSYAGDSCSCSLDWSTPFGVIRTDRDFIGVLRNKGLIENNRAHGREHSIEVQLPFLQFVSKDRLDNLKIAAIMITEDYEEAAEKISRAMKEYGKKAVIICSSDFTHYGISYGYIPFVSGVKEKLKNLDMGAIRFIEDMDPSGFLGYIEDKEATICGKYSIACMMKILKGCKANLLAYYTSGDIADDYSNAVGYASILFI